MFSLRKKKTVTVMPPSPAPAPPAPDVVTLQRLDSLEKRLRSLEDHCIELEHRNDETEKNFKEALEADSAEISSIIKTFTDRVMHIDKEIVNASHYVVKKDELFKLISKLAETLNGIKTDMELPF